MAYQENRLSTQVVPGDFQTPDDLETSALIDYELGGIALNDPTQGLRVQTWTAVYDSGTSDLTLSAPSAGSTVLWNRPGITEISLAFDQNMNPFVAYVQSGQAKYYWWDTNLPGFTTTNLPVGSVTPRCCLDDKRETQTAASDTILAYVLGTALYMRRQRDRFTIDYLQVDPFQDEFGNPGKLRKVGMNHVNRLQFLGTLGDF